MKSDDKSTVSRESDKFMLRLPDGMRDRIAEEAKANGRSMNAEIVARLERSLQANPSADLRIELDTAGMPISWHEIHEYLALIRRTGNLNPSSMAISIITPNLLSSADRQQEAQELAARLDELTKK